MFDDLEVLPSEYKKSGSTPIRVDEFGDVVVPSKKERPKFPCQSCAGTGVYLSPRVHQEKPHCFACKGNGFFYTSEFDRMKARSKAAAAKRSKLDTAKEVFSEANPGFVEILRDVAKWAGIAQDMLSRFEQYGTLSERQVAVILSMKAKADETRAARQAQKEANNAVIDLSAIHAMFAKASESGLKKPAYRAEGFTLTLAKASGKNPGAIYVKRSGGEYLGKVVGNQFMSTSEAKAEDKELLLKIAENPSQVAKDYGKKTGRCCCCGRELTDKISVANGIGPICEAGWGF